MKDNSIFWKTSSDDNAIKLLVSLKDKYLVVQIVERKNSKMKILKQFDSGMQFQDQEGISKQCDFVMGNPLRNMYEFYVIRSV